MGIPCKDHRPNSDEFAHIPFEGPCPDCEIEALKKEAARLVAHSNNVVLQARNHASRANEAEARVAVLEGVLSKVIPNCDYLHHAVSDLHSIGEGCPVENRIDAVLSAPEAGKLGADGVVSSTEKGKTDA